MPVAPPRPKGPPLNALRAFEAAARLGGLAAAAEELCVSPGAVAQQVKALEEWVGVALFERRSQGVQLTPLGADIAEEFESAFDQLGTAIQTLRVKATPTVVRIAALPSIAQLWLSPRLPRMRAVAPDMSISVTVLERAPNLHREPYDLSLFFSSHTNGGQVAALHDEEIFPVCSPELARTLTNPSDLEGTTCLHDVNWSDDWNRWMAAISPASSFKAKGPSFSLYSLAVEEAKQGAGVLIGHTPLVDQHIKSGELIAPFTERVRTGRKLTLTHTESFAVSPHCNSIKNVLCAPQ